MHRVPQYTQLKRGPIYLLLYTSCSFETGSVQDCEEVAAVYSFILELFSQFSIRYQALEAQDSYVITKQELPIC